jgi:Ca-activated chloride channel homolog
VSFREPLLLLGLALVPLALAAYVAAQRRRRRFAVRYTNVDVLASVAARRNWTRHLPALLALLALAVLLVALARPERTVAAEQRQAMVVMVTDTSGSMLATDVRPNRLTAAKEAGRALVDKLPRDFRLGLVGFGTSASLLVEPTTDKLRVRTGLDGLEFAGKTAMGDGLARGLEAARAPVTNELGVPQRLPAAIVLLSDGAQTIGEQTPVSAARRARALRIPISSVALGTAQGVVEVRNPDGFIERITVPPDPRTLRRVASLTRARFYEAPDGARLQAVYEELGSRVGREDEEREITAVFAAAGALLFLGAGAASAFLFGRLP